MESCHSPLANLRNMKKYYCIALTILWIFLSSKVSSATVLNHQVSFKEEIKIDSIIALNGNVFATINLAGSIFTLNEGTPQLPFKLVKLIIPADEEPESVEYFKNGTKVFHIKYPVFPSQKQIPTS